MSGFSDISLADVGAEPFPGVPGARVPGVESEPSVPGERRAGDMLPIKRMKHFRSIGMKNFRSLEVADFCEEQDNYDPRQIEYLIPATEEDIKSMRSAMLEKQITKLEGAIRAREMAEHDSVILSKYRLVAEELHEELRKVKSQPALGSKVGNEANLCIVDTKDLVDLCKQVVSQLRKDLEEPKLPMICVKMVEETLSESSAFSSLKQKPLSDCHEGSVDTMSTVTVMDSRQSSVTSTSNSICIDSQDFVGAAPHKGPHLVKEIEVVFQEKDFESDNEEESAGILAEPEPELSPLAKHRAKLLATYGDLQQESSRFFDHVPLSSKRGDMVPASGLNAPLSPNCGDLSAPLSPNTFGHHEDIDQLAGL